MCKTCYTADRAERHLVNPGKRKMYAMIYAVTHKEQARKSSAKYYRRNRRKVLLAQSVQKKMNHGKRQAYEKEYYKKNLRRIRKRTIKHYRENREQILQARAAYYAENPEKVGISAARRRAIVKQVPIGDLKMIEAWHRKWKKKAMVRCHWCKKKIPGCRGHTDHVIPISKNGPHSLENLVIACARCNFRKKDKMPDEWLKVLRDGD